jgi:hypothetical protein
VDRRVPAIVNEDSERHEQPADCSERKPARLITVLDQLGDGYARDRRDKREQLETDVDKCAPGRADFAVQYVESVALTVWSNLGTQSWQVGRPVRTRRANAAKDATAFNRDHAPRFSIVEHLVPLEIVLVRVKRRVLVLLVALESRAAATLALLPARP